MHAAQFLLISDIHYGADIAAKNGKDTGPELLKTALAKFTELSKDVDFILNLGDLPKHRLLLTATKLDYERILFHKLYEADVYKKPLFYITGNNDALGGNYQPFVDSKGQSPLSAADDWDGACLYCHQLIIDKTHMAAKGYYSSYVMPGNKNIILIALNSAPFARIPMLAAPYPKQEDEANEQLTWLEQQLKVHRVKQVLIAVHIPPGMSYDGKPLWNKASLQRFIAILEQHAAQKQITLLSSHTHMDEIRKLQLSNGSTIYNYLTPSISTAHYNNPAMKIISLTNDFAVKNYTTYYTTNLNHWAKEQYQAVGGKDAIIPHCFKQTLAECLDGISQKELCDRLENGLFWGVKSDRVNRGCMNTYLIRSFGEHN